MRQRILCGAVAAALAAGCVKPPGSITAQYVSHVQYQSLECDQIAEEMARVAARLAEISALQEENARADAALFAVGMLLFWPALLAMPATVDRKGEIGRLKGELEALERLALRKGCALPGRAPRDDAVAAVPVEATH